MEQFTTTISSGQGIDEFRTETLPELLARLGTWGYRVTALTDDTAVLTRERGGIFYYLFRMFHSLALSFTSEGAGTRLTVSGNHGNVRQLFEELASLPASRPQHPIRHPGGSARRRESSGGVWVNASVQDSPGASAVVVAAWSKSSTRGDEMKSKDVGRAGLVGWRETVADKAAPPVAKRSTARRRHGSIGYRRALLRAVGDLCVRHGQAGARGLTRPRVGSGHSRRRAFRPKRLPRQLGGFEGPLPVGERSPPSDLPSLEPIHREHVHLDLYTASTPSAT